MDTESFGSQKQAAPKHRVYRGTWTQSVSGHKNRQCRSTGVYRVGVRVHVIHEGHLFKGTDSCRWHVLVNASRAVWVPSACQSKVSTWQGHHLFFSFHLRGFYILLKPSSGWIGIIYQWSVCVFLSALSCFVEQRATTTTTYKCIHYIGLCLFRFDGEYSKNNQQVCVSWVSHNRCTVDLI